MTPHNMYWMQSPADENAHTTQNLRTPAQNTRRDRQRDVPTPIQNRQKVEKPDYRLGLGVQEIFKTSGGSGNPKNLGGKPGVG